MLLNFSTHVLTETTFSNVHQHVGISAVFDGHLLIMSSKVVVNSFLLGTPGHHIIIKLTPLNKKTQN